MTYLNIHDQLAVIDSEMTGCRTSDRLLALGHLQTTRHQGRSASSIVRAFRVERGL